MDFDLIRFVYSRNSKILDRWSSSLPILEDSSMQSSVIRVISRISAARGFTILNLIPYPDTILPVRRELINSYTGAVWLQPTQ